MALLRLSDTTCDALLSDVLGERPESFSFKQLSVLEASILNEMSRDLLLCFKKKLMKKPGRKSQAKLLHFIWAVSAQPQQESVGQEHAMSDVSSPTPAKFHKIGKIILSLPANAVQVAKHKQQEQAEPIAMSQEDSFFFHVIGEANLFLGDTRIMLSDLDQLEPGDLIVLENSHVSRMFIIEPESKEKIPFPVEISQRHAITIPYKQEFDPMESQQQQSSSRQALWDNLMIEVNAEFEPVKLPLKQLKQMTEGLVIEMGDLIHNGLRLQVEGKTLAWGELIIVGDKFGVRIRKVGDVESGSHASESPYPQIAADHHPAAVNASTAEESGENTDPESFLNEDFDEDDDSEDW